ncbi:hypothetical protein [Edwardsiella tarda]|uniref:hypothetical protein n=1 Tax=Edwardsiella tarda TaxID=636 RepID=UPI0008FFB357|nr:hypothetical protein [Edwardsiella tarda]ATI64584.1 hypothetical protein CPU03_10135 [Edwardsiella tarda]UBU95244.1 hypothetical protein AAW15_16370 [Edwardsiella tarda]
MSTAKFLEPISGDKAYQIRARRALPLLVRQAEACTPISYSDLAEELGMPNPRNLNYVLGSIGQSLECLSKVWKDKVPSIQCIVINKNTGLPGEGIGWFLVKKEDFSRLPLRMKRDIVEAELQHIFSYPCWREVLKILELEPTTSDFTSLVKKGSIICGGGESEQHKALKVYVARNPKIIGLGGSTPIGTTEYFLPSGDSLDVSFDGKKMWVAAEVKSSLSTESDIVRGLFQCVKYRAVMEAVLLARSRPQNARVFLVLEGKFPKKLIPLKNTLGVDVVDGISPKC